MKITPFLPAIAIFLLALLVRLVYNFTVARDYTPMYDSGQFQLIGTDIIVEHCFCLHPYITTTSRAPLWPFLIAGISLMVGRANIYDRLFLTCLGSGTCVFIYCLHTISLTNVLVSSPD